MRVNGLRRWLLVLVVYLVVAGCTVTRGAGLPSAIETEEIKKEQRVVVLLRMTGEADRKPLATAQLSVMLARAGLDTGGAFVLAIGSRLRPWSVVANSAMAEELRAKHPKYFTDDSLEAGWFYFLLQPGTHYLAFGPGQPGQLAIMERISPESLQRAGRLRIDVPFDAPVIYAGTLHFRFDAAKVTSGPTASGFAHDALQIRDETQSARQETARYIGDLGALRTVLVEPVESGPVLLRAPKRDPSR